MVLDRRMQCFIDQIFPIIWDKYMIPVELRYAPEPSGFQCKDITPSVIDVLSKAIWVQSKIAFHHWVRYLRRYYDTMTSTPRNFVLYVAYACNTMGYNIQDHYERFVTVCALLVGFGANFFYSGNGEVLRYIPQILAVFFERVMFSQFYNRGGWRKIDKFLLRQDYINWHDETQIEVPGETTPQKLARELSFAKKVEMAILASGCRDYDGDRIDEKDVECDFMAVKITDEVMTYFPTAAVVAAPVAKKTGSKKPKTAATSQQFDEAAVQSKKDVMKGMMEIVQRARLAQLEASGAVGDTASCIQTFGASSGTENPGEASNVYLETEIDIAKQPEILQESTANSKKEQKASKPNIDDPIPQFIEKIYEARLTSGGEVSNITQKTQIVILQKPDIAKDEPACKPQKCKKRKGSKTKDSKPSVSQTIDRTDTECVESTNNKSIVTTVNFDMNSETCDKKNTLNVIVDKLNSNQPCEQPTESITVNDDKLFFSIEETKAYTPKDLSEDKNNTVSYFKSVEETIEQSRKTSEVNELASENSEKLEDDTDGQNTTECILNLPYAEKEHHVEASQFPETIFSGNNRQKARNAKNTEKILIVDKEQLKNNVESITVNHKQTFESHTDINLNRNFGLPIDDVDLDIMKEKDNECNRDQALENIAQNESFVRENVKSNGASCSNDSLSANYKSKSEAMNAMIKIIDGLGPKIEMFVVMLDSLVWDLKKEC